MGLTEEQLELLGNELIPLYQELEQNVISDIARRVKKTGRYTETAELMAKSLMNHGYSPSKIQSEVMKLIRADKTYQMAVGENTKQFKEYISGEIASVVTAAKEQGNKIVSEAGEMSFNSDLSLWEQAGKSLSEPEEFRQLINVFALQTNKELRNLTQSLGFKGIGFVELENAYQYQLDLGLIKMSSGAYSWQQVVNDCVKDLAQSGLRSINYKSGRTMQLDTAVRNCIMTASSQLAGKVTIMNLESTGESLVEVSQHWGARSDGSCGHADHAYWQGKVYAIDSGTHLKEGQRLGYIIHSLEDATGYPSDPKGLHGYNCRHTVYPFFEGISEPNEWEPEPPQVKVNGKKYDYYHATQKQRQMERNIRSTKREIEAQKVIGGNIEELQGKLHKQIADYKKFSADVNIRIKSERLRVQVGTSNLGKTQVFKRSSESRARREAAEKIFYVEAVEKGDVILAENIYKDLNRSETGKSVLKYLSENNVSVEIINNTSTIQELGMNELYGMQVGKNIYINAVNCNTKKKAVETIIHEKTHMDYPMESGQHIECVCDAMAVKHRKEALTPEDLRGIIKSVQERYPDMKWRGE